MQALVGYGANRLVPQDLYRLCIDEWRLLAPVQKVATVLEVKELGGEYSAKEYDP